MCTLNTKDPRPEKDNPLSPQSIIEIDIFEFKMLKTATPNTGYRRAPHTIDVIITFYIYVQLLKSPMEFKFLLLGWVREREIILNAKGVENHGPGAHLTCQTR